jgi:UV DNA damage endonuclease
MKNEQNLGYACINMQLRKENIFTGRTCRKATFQEKGLDYVGELGLQNVQDLYQIVQWNSRNNIKMYRIGSDIFPWQSEYKLEQLPQYSKIVNILKTIGDYVTKDGQRLSFHPGPFNILSSTKPGVVERTIMDLQNHSEIFDLMGFEPSPYNKINIHVGATYGDKESALDRWCNNFKRLNESTRKRITLENDDKESMFTIADLLWAHERVGVPLVFDFHHHNCHSGKVPHSPRSSVTQATALGWAISTWPKGIKPAVHYSSSRRLNEDSSVKVQAHADYIYETIDTFGYDVDIMLETKAKELALLEYRKKHSILV